MLLRCTLWWHAWLCCGIPLAECGEWLCRPSRRHAGAKLHARDEGGGWLSEGLGMIHAWTRDGLTRRS